MFDFYLRNEFAFAAAQLALAMLGMGAKLALRDFVQVFRMPKSFIIGLTIQLLAVPALAIFVAHLLGVNAGVATGLILIAAVPGGTISNVVTYIGRGNIALSIALTAITSIACLVTTPAILQLLASQSLPADFVMPRERIAFEIALCLLAPLALGMILGAQLPTWRDLISTRAIQLSLFVILLMVIGAAGAGRVDPLQQGISAILAILLLALFSQITALAITTATGLPNEDRTAVAIEVTVRNANLAIMLKASIFPSVPGVADPFADGVLYIALMYGGLAMLVASPLVTYERRRAPVPAQ